jgi:hypothetical protein
VDQILTSEALESPSVSNLFPSSRRLQSSQEVSQLSAPFLSPSGARVGSEGDEGRPAPIARNPVDLVLLHLPVVVSPLPLLVASMVSSPCGDFYCRCAAVAVLYGLVVIVTTPKVSTSSIDPSPPASPPPLLVGFRHQPCSDGLPSRSAGYLSGLDLS